MFPESAYLTAVGSGDSRQSAERNALENLAGRFNMAIHVDERTRERYWHTIENGDIHWKENIDILGYFDKRSGVDNLIGVSIEDSFQDDGGTFFVLAVLDRKKTIEVYSDIIEKKRKEIDDLTRPDAAERNPFEGVDNFRKAAVLADMNPSYAAVLSGLGAQVPPGLQSGNELRRKADEIRRAITIGINVSGDRDDMVRAAFAKVLTGLNFKTVDSDPGYVLEVSVNVTLERKFNKPLDRDITWADQTLLAELKNPRTGEGLLTYKIKDNREGDPVESEVLDWVFRNAVRTIDREYADKLSGYLARVMPEG